MRAARAMAMTIVLVVAGVACGGGGDDAEQPSTTRASSTTAPSGPADPAAAEAEIRAAYATYFDSATATEDGLALAEDAGEIGEVLTAAAAAAPAGARRAEVTGVEFTSPTTADLTFTLFLDDAPVLPDYPGGAVLEDGVWKVTRETNCNLVALQGLTCPEP